ncbi:phage GP46 family protein [Budviciaceae bacterium CWB-B4]|uniref:Phage GP46 family protein n=1 Tax=Limnobaculum xujianqingii TaxID=2738837 RepID=A0A9D7FWE8_9GAMM|nr:phage GP46 family protein [Limnobaculum xujianqingii]MBK5075082.1 phage GP46 family protein [Limnobaculum xujianqingii]MBK5178383.1 phage GP46 family protein [Limnobaculum xujianqingii]
MISDITTVWDVEKSIGDWMQSDALGGELLNGHDLETAILISLFTDGLAKSDDLLDDSDRRGWWGDLDMEFPIGSRLWLLRRQKLTTKVAIKAEDYAKEALQWLVKDGAVSSISVDSQIIYPSTLNLIITYQQPGKNQSSVKFSWVWGAVIDAI